MLHQRSARHILLLSVAMSMSCLFSAQGTASPEKTYAEKLGWPSGSRIVIFHVDDVGMSYESNVGAIRSLEEGVATSWSVMMTCGWMPQIQRYLQEKSSVDVGVHLTLTSEWRNYRWYPVSGAQAVPSLVDEHGYLWRSVLDVMQHATPDDVEAEIRAQIKKAMAMGIKPTHLDSHMGTLFLPHFIERYVKVGIEKDIPVMMMGGHMQHILQQRELRALAPIVRRMSEKLWQAGLPALDDLVTKLTRAEPYEERKKQLMTLLTEMKPGVTQIIVHCSDAGDHFSKISSSGPERHAEMKLMIDSEIQGFIESEGIILTTWRDLYERRKAISDSPEK